MDTRQLNPRLISSHRPWLRGNVLGLASVDVGSCPTGTNVSDIGKGICTKIAPSQPEFPTLRSGMSESTLQIGLVLIKKILIE